MVIRINKSFDDLRSPSSLAPPLFATITKKWRPV